MVVRVRAGFFVRSGEVCVMDIQSLHLVRVSGKSTGGHDACMLREAHLTIEQSLKTQQGRRSAPCGLTG